MSCLLPEFSAADADGPNFFVWLGCVRVTFSTFDQHRVSVL